MASARLSSFRSTLRLLGGEGHQTTVELRDATAASAMKVLAVLRLCNIPRSSLLVLKRNLFVCSAANQKDIVEANLTVLKARMEDLRKKERRIPLPKRLGGVEIANGWRYRSTRDAKLDRKVVKNFALISGCLEVMSTVGGAVGLVFLGGSLGICLVSLLVRHFW